MLRPERMSRVSVTGSKRVLEDVITVLHDLNLVHLEDYGGEWDGFDNGDPLPGADEASERLVTVRSIESILDVDHEDAGPTRIAPDETLEAQIADVREQVNELDDRREELRDELRSVEERIDAIEPFAELGIDLDLLSGYDSIVVRVGEGDATAVEDALRASEAVDAVEVHAVGDIVAAFIHPAPEATQSIDDVLVGVQFQAFEVPEATGSPDDYLEEREHEREQLNSRLRTVQDELEDLKLEVAGFLLAAEERLSVEVQKREAPLSFATTKNAFLAEGWIPTTAVAQLESALESAVGAHVEIEELERADYDDHGHGHGEGEAAADGGTTLGHGDPPVVQDNPGYAKPFELLVQTISRPRYDELDPTVILLLTFPAFFGFMIGDVGYGILYTAIGWVLYTRFESDAIRSLGGIAAWAGGFTILFGFLYGEFFGLHLITEYLWVGSLGLHSAPMHKGLQPAEIAFAQGWLVVVMLVGVAHLTVGYLFDFIENLQGHGLKDAILESGSWALLMTGVWV
ncbi:MAG: V-type ATPase 116kDa subunit family protein, partial [Halobacteriales archaeon]|nr:V-type ATPase 116kDa subunit family protein [Halobacteriales archaeon]